MRSSKPHIGIAAFEVECVIQQSQVPKPQTGIAAFEVECVIQQSQVPKPQTGIAAFEVDCVIQCSRTSETSNWDSGYAVFVPTFCWISAHSDEESSQLVAHNRDGLRHREERLFGKAQLELSTGYLQSVGCGFRMLVHAILVRFPTFCGLN